MIQSKANNISTLVVGNLLKAAMVMLLVSFALSTFGQGWEKTFGGDSEEQGEAIIQTNDYGYLTVGWSESFGEDNDVDVYVIRTDVDGTLIWQKVFDEGIRDRGYSVIETADKNFLIVGDIETDIDSEFNSYLLKIDPTGKKIWSKVYGDPALKSQGFDLCEIPGGGFALLGQTETENGDDDILLIRVDENGEELWSKTYGGDFDDVGTAIVVLEDGFALLGNIEDGIGNDQDIYISKVDFEGNVVWVDTTLATNELERGNDLILTQDDKLVIAGVAEGGSQAFLAKYNLDGDKLWFKWFDEGEDDEFTCVIEDSEGNLVVTGLIIYETGNVDVILGKFDSEGNQIWFKTLGNDGELFDTVLDVGYGVAATVDGGYVITGYNAIGLLTFANDVTLIKTDANGNIHTNYITGQVYSDEGNCDDFDIDVDLPLEDWLVIAKGSEKSFIGTTDENGTYNIRVDTGSYEVNVLAVNDYWTACQEDGYLVNFEEFYDTTFQVNFSIIKEIDCPYLEVDISAEFLTICSDIDYTVAYCNLGTGAAEDAYVDLVIDEDLTVNGASLPFTQVGDSLYRFDLGTINSTECGSFVLNAALPCDGIATGQAGLVSAHIFPDTICTQPGPNWDGSSIIVAGACIENDTIIFEVKNVGDGNMEEPIHYYIVEDDVIVFISDPVELEPDMSEFDTIDATGATYRIIAEQSVDHPGMGFPTTVVEGCSEDGNYNTGFVTQFPENDQDPFIAIDVQEAIDINSELPQVNLRGYPKGFYNNEVVANTDLTYIITFENTGVDTINRIVIRDTIPEELDIESVVPGSSSHPYDFEIYENGILKFTFNEIQLQPSGSAEATNRGFVKFRIAQKPDLSVGTQIKNSAAVFFDYHAPLRTQVVEHQISNCLSFFPTEELENCFIVTDVGPGPNNPEGIKIKVHPNPFFESATIEIEGELYDEEVTFELYDLYGQLIRRNYFKGQNIMVYRNHLPSGMYIFRLESKGQQISSGRLVVR